MLLSSWIKPAENATVIEWEKRRSLMTKLSNGLNPVFFLTQLRIWFRTASYFIRWRIAVCVWLWKQTNSSLKIKMDIWSCSLPLLSTRRTLLSGDSNKRSNGRLKELSVTLFWLHVWRAWDGTETNWTLEQSANSFWLLQGWAGNWVKIHHHHPPHPNRPV